MLIAILFTSPFFASIDVQRGDPVIRDPDIWWHLRNAQTLISTHHFIRQDLYSFTTGGQRWINPEWLGEIPYYLGFRLLGERGLFLVMLLAVELFIAAMLVRCYRRSGEVSAAFFAVWIAVLLAAINIGPRTILLGWLCFLIELLLLEAFQRGVDRLWWMIPLFALWINVHGSWVIGYVFFALFVACGLPGESWGDIHAMKYSPAQRRKLLAVALLIVPALLVNPYGWALVKYPFDMLLHQRLNLASVEEWQPVALQSFYGTLLFVLAAGTLVFTLARRRRWMLHDLIWALLAFYLAVGHRRFLLLAGVILCPILAVELEGVVFAPYDPSRDKRPYLNVLFIVAFYAFALTHIPSTARLHKAEAQYFPVGALPALQSNCANRHVFNRYEWGGFLIWNARQTPVFIDSRTDIFEYNGVLAEYIQAESGHDVVPVLQRYGIGCVLMNPDSPMVAAVASTPGWSTRYRDAVAVLLVRNSGPPQPH
jgi:hypothetical protein